MTSRSKLFAALVSLAYCLVGLVVPALAHETVAVGPYELEIGWLSEPPLAGERNAVLVTVARADTTEPMADLAALRAAVSIGGRRKELGLGPMGDDRPGQVAADFIPTVRGVYTLTLSGAIGSEAVDVSVDLDEVEEASVLQFPEPLASSLTLQERLNEAEAALSSIRIIAYAALAVSGASLLAAVAALLHHSRR